MAKYGNFLKFAERPFKRRAADLPKAPAINWNNPEWTATAGTLSILDVEMEQSGDRDAGETHSLKTYEAGIQDSPKRGPNNVDP